MATLTLNRPEARNALNQTMIRELGLALARLDGDAEARVVVIRGAGERAFCAGADLKGMFRTGSILDAREQYAGLAQILEGDATDADAGDRPGPRLRPGREAAGWPRPATS